jgi:cytoskeletal protein RodZ
MSYQNFTSLPPDQEATFIVYESRTQESAKKAMTLGLVSGLIFFVLVVAIVFSHDKPKNKMEGDDMGQLSNQAERDKDRATLQGTTPTPATDTAAPAAPATDTAAQAAPATDPAAPAAPATPTPPAPASP